MSRARDLADGTFSGAFSADSPTLVVDDTNNRVGVGTATPTEPLDVSGNIRALGANSRMMFGPDGYEASIKYATDASFQIASRTGEVITFTNGTDGTERLRILPNGGITFNGDTAAANALDDYEEGTWTPTVDSGTVSYTAARYLKVGDLVTAWAYNIVFSDWTSTTQVKISGLPFTSHTNSPAVGTFFARYRDNSAAIQTFIPNNAAYIRYYENSRTGGFIALSHNMFNNAANAAYITITYEAA